LSFGDDADMPGFPLASAISEMTEMLGLPGVCRSTMLDSVKGFIDVWGEAFRPPDLKHIKNGVEDDIEVQQAVWRDEKLYASPLLKQIQCLKWTSATQGTLS
jgi:hypothetical protein